MRQGRLGLWLALAVVIASALSVGNIARSARWEATLHLAPVGFEVAASTEQVRFEFKI